MPKTVPIAFTSYYAMDIGCDNGLVVDLDYEDNAPYTCTGAVKSVVIDASPRIDPLERGEWDSGREPAPPGRRRRRVVSERYETILYEKDGPVATLTMNRPDRMNSMTNRMVLEAGQALAEAAEDAELRVLVLTGAGRAFCPGADLQGVVSGSGADARLRPDDFSVPVLLHELPAVTIAAVNGACAGAGFGWACACDLRIAARSARFNTAFLDVGVAGDMGGPWTLSRLVGPSRARELYFLPRKFDVDEALAIGLVSQVVDDEGFAAAVDALVGRLRAAAPLAVRALKANFVDAERMDLASFVRKEAERHLQLFTSEDTREAFAARVEKRTPHFVGR